ncbi:serine/threonine protein kinase [Alginatibacterium sediminis]|uniref:Stress response kinase A n=1 Tax=Alginatibacterium sediminis TaxID=2164068 RepID=A0A420ENF9_9ALTE|nr:serine/threonine protein kinase [Alginatibacterium sediminis]RKF22208.1 serine/threonine protein kinase [Alginatibacterium sediminis]
MSTHGTQTNAFDFTGLNPSLLLDAIESKGIYASSGLLALNSYENRVYQFIAEDGLRYVAKFYRPQRWSSEQILEEHQYSLELQAAEVPVVAPLLLDGQSLFEYQGYQFTLFPSMGGRSFELDNLEHLERLGQHLGRMHQVSLAKPFEHRLAIDLERYVEIPLERLRKWVPKSIALAFFTIAEHVAQACREQYHPSSMMRLHGDCHAGNVLWRDGPIIVDLDDCSSGPAIQDLWMLLSGEHAEQRLQMETVLEGYEEFVEFDRGELKLIEPLRAMRMIHYMGWLALRWEDLAFQQAFPWFNTQNYWEQQILSLKEQLSRLQQAPLQLIPLY